MFEDESTTEADLAVGRVLAAGPGPEAAAALAGIDLAVLTAAGRLDAMAAWQAQSAWVDAQSAALLAAHVRAAENRPEARGQTGGYVVSSALHEVGLVLHLSPVAVGIRCQVASDLADRLPAPGTRCWGVGSPGSTPKPSPTNWSPSPTPLRRPKPTR